MAKSPNALPSWLSGAIPADDTALPNWLSEATPWSPPVPEARPAEITPTNIFTGTGYPKLEAAANTILETAEKVPGLGWLLENRLPGELEAKKCNDCGSDLSQPKQSVAINVTSKPIGTKVWGQ